MPYLGKSEVEAQHRAVVSGFESGITLDYNFRYKQLEGIYKFIVDNEPLMIEALHQDLHKSTLESVTTEIMVSKTHLTGLMGKLKGLMQPRWEYSCALMLPGHSYVRNDPLGAVLIIGPFNFPVQLVLVPLIDAIAAGNTCVVKPSEITQASSKLFASLLPKYVDSRVMRIVEGAVAETTILLSLKWDFIFFTGSTMVGKIVHQAAAKSLTPCLLELGGKSPAYIDQTVRDLRLTARRICWGKFGNAGQACVAPDYLVVHEKVVKELEKEIVTVVKEFYAENPKGSPDFGRIISERHVLRLKHLLDKNKDTVLIGGDVDVAEKYVAPTVVTNCSLESSLMTEEIFGPILPIISVKGPDEAINIMRHNPKPLALYIFAHDEKLAHRIMDLVPSGGVTVNDVVVQFANHSLPFGGIGPSGLGRYHGKYSWEAFTHTRAVMWRWDHWTGDVWVRYPPFGEWNLWIFRGLMYWFVNLEIYSHIVLPLIYLGLLCAVLGALAVWKAEEYAPKILSHLIAVTASLLEVLNGLAQKFPPPSN